MSASPSTHDPLPTLRLSNPADAVDAIPYLIGFHPRDSLVLLGLAAGRLVVTVRMDLADADDGATLHDTASAVQNAGATLLLAAVYAEARPERHFITRLERIAADVDCELADMLFIRDGRWWSLRCRDERCCPSEGTPLTKGTSAFRAGATYAGIAVLPGREALEATLAPLPNRERLGSLIAEAEDVEHRALLDGRTAAYRQKLRYELFVAACASDDIDWRPEGAALTDAKVARLGVGLSAFELRDSVWIALDEGLLDGSALWRELARRLPPPYNAAPLFLLGWRAWRNGNGALANIAANQALVSDPEYTAAELLGVALSRGLSPRQVPPIRPPGWNDDDE